jgi:SnoaL-like polyketide cyclase
VPVWQPAPPSNDSGLIPVLFELGAWPYPPRDLYLAYRGTDEGGFIPNMPATGRAFEMEAMYLVRINDEGQIAEHWGVVDTIGTMGQLGLLPRPE